MEQGKRAPKNIFIVPNTLSNTPLDCFFCGEGYNIENYRLSSSFRDKYLNSVDFLFLTRKVLNRKDGAILEVKMESLGENDKDGPLTQVRSVLWDIIEKGR